MPITITDIKEMKKEGRKIPMLTAYDYPSAKLLDEIGIPIILVGDSLGQVVLGYDSTVKVNMDDMLHHTKAVARGVQNSFIVSDMPFMSYQIDIPQAIYNAGRFIQDGGAHGVKLEGGESVSETVRAIVKSGIPVMGHIGLIPQSVHQLGGYRIQGKTIEVALQLIRDAQVLEDSGVFAIVLESVPAQLSSIISDRISIPTIGIGAGVNCDGQVQVLYDMMGLFSDFVPKHVKRYAALDDVFRRAVREYMDEVEQISFPTEKESFFLDESFLKDLRSKL